jgi:hypothetical protein
MIDLVFYRGTEKRSSLEQLFLKNKRKFSIDRDLKFKSVPPWWELIIYKKSDARWHERKGSPKVVVCEARGPDLEGAPSNLKELEGFQKLRFLFPASGFTSILTRFLLGSMLLTAVKRRDWPVKRKRHGVSRWDPVCLKEMSPSYRARWVEVLIRERIRPRRRRTGTRRRARG